MNCRVCDQKMQMIDKIKCINGHARLNDKPFEIPFIELELYQCSNCGHVQTENCLDNDFYDDYEGRENGASCYWSDADSIYCRRMEKLHSLNQGKNILDIGCGTGYALLAAKKYYDRCVGIEPSRNDYNIATKRGLNVINSYFDLDIQMQENFDAIMCNMLLEHLDNPREFLKMANCVLNAGGVMLVSIPDGESIINQGIYHQFLSEHINYYSLVSFGKLAHDCGFDVVEVERDERLLELNFYLRKRGAHIGISQVMQAHAEKLKSAVEGLNNVLVWGGGAKAATYSLLLKDIPVFAVVDSDEDKKGKYISGINVPIKAVEKDIILQSDAVIILASAYNAEIISSLRKLHYSGKVIFFEHKDNSIKILEEIVI